MKMKTFLKTAVCCLFLWLYPTLYTQAKGSDKIKKSIITQLSMYPRSTLKDIYKNHFQDSYGPGHLMPQGTDARNQMRAYLEKECEIAKTDVDPSPYYVPTGYKENFYRVNLSVINEGKVPFDTFFEAFCQSAEMFKLPQIEDWKKEWGKIMEEIKNLNLNIPDFKKDSCSIDSLLNAGQYASHHSSKYVRNYHPHYRLIEKKIFDKEILPLLLISKAEEKDFTIQIDEMIPRNYYARTLEYGYFITIKDHSAAIYLPYMGQIYQPQYSNNGLDFECSIDEYFVKDGKNGKKEVTFTFQKDFVDYLFRIEICPNGKAYVKMQSSNAQGISYEGYIE